MLEAIEKFFEWIKEAIICPDSVKAVSVTKNFITGHWEGTVTWLSGDSDRFSSESLAGISEFFKDIEVYEGN